MTHPLLRFSLVVACLLSAVALRPSQAQQPASPAQRLTWTPATIETTEGAKQRIEGERGRLVVEERWQRPTGRTITIQLVRLKSTSTRPGAPTVYLAGGPGGSGIASLTGDRFPLFQKLREVGDVIALDQRGVRSDPFPVCRDPFTLPLDRPASRQAWLPVYRDASRKCADRWRAEGVDIGAYNTTESAGDLAALSEALGSPINLLGISYGTHLGLETVRRYPDRVGRAVFAGVEGMDDTLKLPSQFDRHLARVSALVKADATASALVPDVTAAFLRLREQLADGIQVSVPGSDGRPTTVTVGPADLQMAAFEMSTQRRALEQFPVRLAQLASGDLTPLGLWALSRRQQPGLQVLAMVADCVSGASAARRDQIAREAPTSLMGDAINLPFPEVCDAWQVPDAGDAFRAPIVSNVPALFISGSLDGRTPEENASAVARGFVNARRLLLDPAGHDDDLLISTPELIRLISVYLGGGDDIPERLALPPIRFARRQLPAA